MTTVALQSQVDAQRCWPWAEFIAPCQAACPLRMDIAGFVTAIAQGRFKDAIRIERESMPTPGICGWLCQHPCEEACIRQKIEAPIAVQSLRRFIADYELNVGMEKPAPVERTREEKVAIMGSGPAGLVAACDLARQGYGVTIYEASSMIGGMLTSAIPQFVLPREIVESGISYVQALGVEIENNSALGKELSLEDLFRRGYKSVFLALGTQGAVQLDIPGMHVGGVLNALPLLQDVNSGKKVEIKGRVVVIGGGNVAIQAARSAIRLGAAEVQLACLESREEMPAYRWEIERAEEEGVKIHPSFAPREVIGKEGRVVGISFSQVREIEFDVKGGIKPILVPGSEHVMDAEVMIVAIGQLPDLSFLAGAPGLDVDERGAITVAPDTLATSLPGVFAGGDIVSGRGTVMEAMAEGRKAALSIDGYLRGREVRKGVVAEAMEVSDDQIPRFVERRERQEAPKLPLVERIRSFKEVDLGFTEEMAINEAKRCLNCIMCGNCIFYRSQMCYEVASRLL